MKNSIKIALALTALVTIAGCSKKDEAKAEPGAPDEAAQVSATNGQVKVQTNGAQVKVQGGGAAAPAAQVQAQGGAVRVNVNGANGTSLAANGTTVQHGTDTATVAAGGAAVKLGGPNNPKVVRAEDGRQIALQGDKVELKAADGRRVVVNPDGTFNAQDPNRPGTRVNVNGANVDVAALAQ